MSPLDALAPDQRAVVSLVLRPDGRYEDVAAVLGIPVPAVRSRAHAGLAALAPGNGLPAEITAPLADYLLGQLSEADAAATHGLMAESAPARAWAAGVAQALAPAAPGPLPEIPGGPPPATDGGGLRPLPEIPGGPPPTTDVVDAEPAPEVIALARPTTAASPSPAQPGLGDAPAEDPPADAPPGDDSETAGEDLGVASGEDSAAAQPPPSSRLGGAVLIAGVLGVVALVLFLLLRGGNEPQPPPATPAAATATPTATAAAAQVADQIDLTPVEGSGASGRMTVFLQDDRLLFQIQAQDVPPSGGRAAYAVWLTGPGTRARRLGYTDPVGQDGALGIQGPGDADLDAFPRWYATYTHVVVSRETDDSARRPGGPVLRGPLPRGRRDG